MRQMAHWAALGAIAVLAAGCGASTEFSSTWVEPSAQPLNLDKPIVAVMVTDRDALRRSGEASMVREIEARGGKGLASYSILPAGVERDTARAHEILTEAGADAVIMVRPVGKDTRVSYSPGTPYYSTWGYWGYGWGSVYSPGYLRTDEIVSVETLVYSVAQDKLLFAGQSETMNPANLDSFVRDIGDALGYELRKAGLIRAEKQ